MRFEPTPAEKALWKVLRDRRLAGLKFRRQVPMRDYIADFVCFSPRLVIEADGKAHQDPAYDARRDAWFASEKFKVLRFPNQIVVTTPDVVINAILNAAALSPTYDR
jgi:very-short-patch-repair endonuclease